MRKWPIRNQIAMLKEEHRREAGAITRLAVGLVALRSRVSYVFRLQIPEKAIKGLFVRTVGFPISKVANMSSPANCANARSTSWRSASFRLISI
jgi:hypothetical protein